MSIKTRQAYTNSKVNNNGYLPNNNNGAQPIVIPDGKEVSWYTLENGNNYFDVIPYKISSKEHPLVRRGLAEIGEDDDVLEYTVHFSINENRDTFICLKEQYGESCPICEARDAEFNRLKSTGLDGKKAWKELPNHLKSKVRVLYNVIDWKNRDKGIQLFTASQFVLDNGINGASKVDVNDEYNEVTADTYKIYNQKLDTDEEYILYSSPNNGMGVKITCEEGEFEGKTYPKPISFNLQARKQQYKPEIINEAYPLDSFLYHPTYDEVYKAYYGVDRDATDDIVDPEPEEDINNEVVSSSVPAEFEETKKENKCPKGLSFAFDFDTSEKCDACMEEDIKTYKACLKANSALETI